MSSPDNSSPARDGNTPNQDDKPRLTEAQKRQNHISSEQKRRQAIRTQFDRLSQLVPGLEGQGRSEGHVLNVTVQFILEQIEERKRLIREIEAKGGKVPEELKEAARVDLSLVNTEHIAAAMGQSSNGAGDINGNTNNDGSGDGSGSSA